MPTSSPSRRRFVRQSAALALGGLAAPLLPACGGGGVAERAQRGVPADSTDARAASRGQGERPVGVAILGLGGYAEGQIAPALKLTEHCRLAGLITGTPAKLPGWQRAYGVDAAHCYTYDELERVADDDAIDVVYVITPTSTHRGFVERAAAAGKHVWCEKPMALTRADCQAMIDACARAGVQLAIGYRMLHEPNTRDFIAYCAGRPLGPLAAASSDAGYAGSAPPADYWRGQASMGGGALYDMGVYTVNGLRYATGLLPEAVVAAARERQERPDGVDLTTRYTLRFPGGVLAEARTSVVEEYNRLRATFRDGWAMMRPMQPYRGVRGETSTGVTFAPSVPNQQSLQMDADALAIRRGEAPRAPGSEGLIDVAIIEAVLASAASGEPTPLTWG